jgi:ribosomal protein RSM22 (predicted rRNA methylase)
MNARHFSFPESLEKNLESLLAKNNLSLAKAAELAVSIKKLSDHFTTIEGQKTPWEHWAAYMVYFFPLNVVRLRAVFEECFRDFPWEKVSTIIDFGSGPGTGHAALESTSLMAKKILSIETDNRAQDLHRQLDLTAWSNSFDKKLPAEIASGTLGIFSYSLLEETAIERRLKEFDHLLIVMPSTRTQGRHLLEIRQTLQTEGFFSWAPCTHQQACPLLTQSKTDWCHDRILFDAPEWFKKLESHLPSYNHSLTFSYWFSSRTEKPADRARAARLIGDTLYEKGKVRQMVCRGPNREFLAWLTRNGEPEPIARGSLIELPESPILKGNEIRL